MEAEFIMWIGAKMQVGKLKYSVFRDLWTIGGREYKLHELYAYWEGAEK